MSDQHSRVPRLVTAGSMTNCSSSSFSTSTTSMTTHPKGPYSSIPSIAMFGQKSQLGTTCASHLMPSKTFFTASQQTSPLRPSTTTPTFRFYTQPPHRDQPHPSTNMLQMMPQPPNSDIPSTSTDTIHPHFQPDPFDDNDEVDDPGEEFLEPIPDKPEREFRGIGQGKAKPKEEREKRQFLTCDPHGGFSDKDAKRTLSNLIRINFNTRNVKWDKVPKFRKDKIWNQFEMRYRWDSNDNKLIAEQFDKTCRRRYTTCVSNVKTEWELGYKVKWLSDKQIKRLVRYWMRPEVQAEAERMRSNRGVIRDENGKTKPAPKTYKRSSLSMYDRDRDEAKLKGRQFEGLCLETIVRTHVDLIPNLPDSELYTGRPDLVWVDDSARQKHELYTENLAKKYKENEDQMPTPLAPIDSVVWQEAVGGMKRGLVPGISYEINPETLGFITKRRPSTYSPPQSQAESSQVCQLKKQVEQQKQNFEEKIEAITRAQRDSNQQFTHQIEMLLQSRSGDRSLSSHKLYEAQHQPHSVVGSGGQSREQPELSQDVPTDIGRDFMKLLRCDGGFT